MPRQRGIVVDGCGLEGGKWSGAGLTHAHMHALQEGDVEGAMARPTSAGADGVFSGSEDEDVLPIPSLPSLP